ncbi:MAG: hypothetical protein J6386_09500 [Candidatus Synoicihabitans palmerolidicus]|nr:hypothetical protein [Candidatus Synoicihabitans palmerolidicus]
MKLPSLFNTLSVGAFTLLGVTLAAQTAPSSASAPPRERVSLNAGWTFYKYAQAEDADDLIYDVRPEVVDAEDARPADAKPTEAVAVEAHQPVLKPWILPTGNRFLTDPARHHIRPEGNPGHDFPFVQADFDDTAWEPVTLPHDWAIAGPFMAGDDAPVGGGMGRLPSPGVAWYRKSLDIPASDAGKSLFLEVEGAMSYAMSYAMVWLNGHWVGGWPYGYTSWQVDLTPYIVSGGVNQLAILPTLLAGILGVDSTATSGSPRPNPCMSANGEPRSSLRPFPPPRPPSASP